MQILKFKTFLPSIAEHSRVASQAILVGQVQLGIRCSVWPFAVIRGDLNPIIVGNETNIQEHVVIHVSHDSDVQIGNRVTIGHSAIVHGCHIASDCLIGMHATLLDGAKIGHHCIIGANALIPPHKEIPPYSMVMGIPGKVVRSLTSEDVTLIEHSAQSYVHALPDFPF